MQRAALRPDAAYDELCFDFPQLLHEEAVDLRDALSADMLNKGDSASNVSGFASCSFRSMRFPLRRRFLDGVVYCMQGRRGVPVVTQQPCVGTVEHRDAGGRVGRGDPHGYRRYIPSDVNRKPMK